MSHPILQLDDTICAIATSAGPGGIGIVRLSGPKAVDILSQIFRSRRGRRLSRFESHKIYYGQIVDPHKNDEILDEVLAVLMRAPKSYTREDVVEISCHGGSMVVKMILALSLRLGGRLASGGEFTKRAFLNGRIDLLQAQAVADIIQAKTESFLKVSAHQLKGDLTLQLEKIRADLMEAYVHLEALVNFPEDDLQVRGRDLVAKHLAQANAQIAQLLETSQQGRLLRDGAKVVLCGRPNVGKSSLLNVLLKQPRAIVSEIAGTTRDSIEEPVQLGSVALQLIDTAGILQPRDAVEQQAVERSHWHIQTADLALLVFCSSENLTAEDLQIAKSLKGRNVLVVVNKHDLAPALLDKDIQELLPGCKIVRVSAVSQTGIAQLQEAIETNILQGKTIDTHQVVLTHARHIESLEEAQRNVEDSQKFLEDNLSLEFICENLKAALTALDRITGRDVDEDLLEDIFSNFCIGK